MLVLEFIFRALLHIFRAKSIQPPPKNGPYAYDIRPSMSSPSMSGPSLFNPAMSTPAKSSVNVQSCNFSVPDSIHTAGHDTDSTVCRVWRAVWIGHYCFDWPTNIAAATRMAESSRWLHGDCEVCGAENRSCSTKNHNHDAIPYNTIGLGLLPRLMGRCVQRKCTLPVAGAWKSL